MSATVDRQRLAALYDRERTAFVARHPRSRALAERAERSLIGAVPMPFMTAWPGAFPIFVTDATGAHVTDVDGIRYDDFCLGDSAAMAGHAPAQIVAALAEHSNRGPTHMLPTEDSIEVAEELGQRFGLPFWQFTVSATDANRFALRIARKITGRQKVVVFNWCYHGTVDEASVAAIEDSVTTREPHAGQPVDPTLTTRVVEFNDPAGLEHALEDGEVACVLAEPAMTNIGIVHPAPGFHGELRELTRRHGALLIIDETHTLCMGPGGCTQAWGLIPDMLVVGKAIAGGMPAATYGLSADTVERLRSSREAAVSVTGGIGGTLAGNALGAKLMNVTLRAVLGRQAFETMVERADRYVAGAEAAIDSAGAPWHIAQLGSRAEYRFVPEPPRSGSEALAGEDPELSGFMHLYALNRGVLLTPFHNMALMSPVTTEEQVDRAIDVFERSMHEVLG